MTEKSVRLPELRGQIVLNALPLKAGGGLQKTSSFLRVLGESSRDLSRFKVIVRENSILENICDEFRFQKYVVKDSRTNRLLFEIQSRFLLEKNSLCFTLSGPVLLGSAGHLINVTECAYSNLLYPELDFWSGFSGLAKAKKKLVDEYRKKMTKAADFWIFQTDVLRDRAVTLFGFPETRTRVVRIAPSVNVGLDKVVGEDKENFNRIIPEGLRLLFLNGPNPNKRLHLLPPLVKALKVLGVDNVVVVTTMPEDHDYTKVVKVEFEKAGLSDGFCNLGRVATEQASSCIDCCDVVCTLSVLESFSNNFMEAWKMGKPLIATDADWARSAAEGAALYIDLAEPISSAERVYQLVSDHDAQTLLVQAGYRRLEWYSSPEEKVMDYLTVLSDAQAAGPCTKAERKNIRW